MPPKTPTRPRKRTKKESVVDRNYRDYSRVTVRELLGPDYTGVRKDRFPSKIYAILSTPEYANIVCWRPHGRAWVVLDKAQFTAVVMPRYFDAKIYGSFCRLVTGWGFKVRVLFCADGVKSKLHILTFKVLTHALCHLPSAFARKDWSKMLTTMSSFSEASQTTQWPCVV